MNIRPAARADHAAIGAVVSAAFATLTQSNGKEADIVEGVRGEGSVLVELVAEDAGEIVGQVLFSRMTCDRPLLVAALGPVAVAPHRHSHGVGSALIRTGLEACKALGVQAVIVLGHPDYYPRFGFSADAAAQIDSPYAGSPAFMALALESGALDPPLKVDYPAAFS